VAGPFGAGFPGLDQLDVAAGSLAALPDWSGQEGIRWSITLGPGCISIGRQDRARAERTAERTAERAHLDAQEAGRYHAEYVGDRADADPRAPITGWSRRSRARLFRATGEIDYTPMIVCGRAPVMTTLTYPDQWLRVAPTGAAAKKHLDTFWKRFERAWCPFCGLWKEEFQRRGAVHFHLWHPYPDGLAGADRWAEHQRKLAAWEADKAAGKAVGRKPGYRKALGDGLPYEEWARVTWADIVDHPDPKEKRKHLEHGAQVSEVEEGHVNTPARLAAYFAKHGAFMAKDYQNKVPKAWREPGKGPGRFWGYKALKREVRAVDISPIDANRAARLLRRLASRERYWDPTYVNAEGEIVGCYRWKKAVREVRVKRTRREPQPRERYWDADANKGRGGYRWRKIDPARRPSREPRHGGRMVRSHYPDVIGLAGAQYLEPAETTYRKAMRPVARFVSGSGFLCLDDAPTTLVQISRALDIWREYNPETDRQRSARIAGKVRRAQELPRTAKRARADERPALEELTSRLEPEALAKEARSEAGKVRADSVKRQAEARVFASGVQARLNVPVPDQEGDWNERMSAVRARRADELAASLARFRAALGPDSA
jgi:hypothetical protein